MRFDHATDRFVEDMRADGRMRSDNTEQSYRYVLDRFAKDHSNPEVGEATRAMVKRTLAHWPNPATRKQRHAVLTSFFDWAVYEGLAVASPAREVKPTRVRPNPKTRLTRSEVLRLLDAAEPVRRDRWAVNLLLYTGARNAELRGLRGRDLARDGWVRLFGKGGKERWVPVVPELRPIVDEIRALITPDGFVLPGQRSLDPPHHTMQYDAATMLSSSALRRQIMRVGDRAGIALHVHPHLLRHSHGDAVARYAGVRVAQAVLGHESIETTVGTYTGSVSLDELAASMTGFGFRSEPTTVRKEGS